MSRRVIDSQWGTESLVSGREDKFQMVDHGKPFDFCIGRTEIQKMIFPSFVCCIVVIVVVDVYIL